MLGWYKEYRANEGKITFSGQDQAPASQKTRASRGTEGQSKACAASPGTAAEDGGNLPGSPETPESEETKQDDRAGLAASIMDAGDQFIGCGKHIKAGLSDAKLLVELQGLQTVIEEIEAEMEPVLKELELSLAV